MKVSSFFFSLKVMESILHQFRVLAHGLRALNLEQGKREGETWPKNPSVATKVDKAEKGLTNMFFVSDHAGLVFSAANVHPLGIGPK